MTLAEIRAKQREVEKIPMSPERWGADLELQREILNTPEYQEYERAVVKLGIETMGEEWRKAWETMSFESGFYEGLTPEEEVDAQIEAMQDSF